MSLQNVSLSAIQTAGLQVRAETDRGHVDDLAELMGDDGNWPAELPPVIVFYDGSAYFLADGHHRYQAAQEAGVTEIPCEVHLGDKTAALWYAVSANSQHGLRRTNEDKRRAVMLAYQLEPSLSDNAIAKRCHVSPDMANYTLRSLRSQSRLSESDSSSTASGSKPSTVPTSTAALSDSDSGPAPDIRTDARGREMDVSRIGKSKPSKPVPIAEGAPWQAAAVRMGEIVQQLRAVQKEVNELATMPGAELLRSSELVCERRGEAEAFRSRDVLNFVRGLEYWRPHASCPACKLTVRNGCDVCKGLGWLNEEQHQRLPDRLKA